MSKYIIVRTHFEGIHNWPDCPHEDVAFLRNKHRHIFHVEVKIEVSHNNRDLEFIRVKRAINSFIQTSLGKNLSNDCIELGSMSCEDIAELIIHKFMNWPIRSVSIFEDNENGALIEVD